MKKIIFAFLLALLCLSLHLVQAIEPASKVTVDIKGMDVVDVLKMLSTKAGLNIVVGKNVAGRVNLFLKDVDAQDAFDIVILSNDLAYKKQAGIVNVMTQRDYELLFGARFGDVKQVKTIKLKYAKAAALSGALTQIKSSIGKVIMDEGTNTLVLMDTLENMNTMLEFIKNTDLPLETKVFSLNYAEADKISTKLQEAVSKNVGSVKIDERTNKLVVTDYPARIQELSRIIAAFDEKNLQVLIDAQIIQIKPSEKFQMGIDWNYWISKYFEVRGALPVNTANTIFIGTTTKAPTEPGQYKVVIDILNTIGKTNILSSPQIMVLNNQEAKIMIGTKDAYITSTTSLSGSGTSVVSQTVNFVDTGIQLAVTPTINKEGFVTMKIRPEISTAETKTLISEDKKTDIPIVTTSEAETTVMVKDGVTVIIGGLKQDQKQRTEKRFPILGKIPILGYLFGSTEDSYSKNDLVILLTPYIISGESSLTDLADLPLKEGAVVSMDKKGEISMRKVSSFQQEEAMRKLSLKDTAKSN